MSKDYPYDRRNKTEYLCSLVDFVQYRSDNVNLYVARIYRLERHARLGPPPADRITTTSPILWINFQKKIFETQNSIYRWI